MKISPNKNKINYKLLLVLLAIYLKSIFNFVLKYKTTTLLVSGAALILVPKYNQFISKLSTENEKLLFQAIVTFGILSLGKSTFLLMIKDHILIKKILSQKLFELVFSLKILLFCSIFILIGYLFKVDVKSPINWSILIGFLFYNYSIRTLKVRKPRIDFRFLWKIPIIGNHSYLSSGIKLIINSVNKNHVFTIAILYVIAVAISFYSQVFMNFSATVVFTSLVSTINLSFITLATDDIGSRGISLDRKWIKKNIIGETAMFTLFYIFILPVLIGAEYLYTDNINLLTSSILFFGCIYTTLVAITIKYLYPENKFIQLFIIGLNIVAPFIFVYYFRKAFKNENY